MVAPVIAVLALFATQAGHAPKRSPDVVAVRVYPGSLADGLETDYVSVKVKDGWSLDANPGDGKVDANALQVIEFLADGRRGRTGSSTRRGSRGGTRRGSRTRPSTASSASSAEWCMTT
jgi:hypothetical protein